MIILHTIQTLLSLYLFHKLFNKPNCSCLKSRILDTCLIIIAFIPTYMFMFKYELNSYATIVIMILTIGAIRYLKKYNYKIDNVLYDW